ncbi:PREDICTED: katanin p80 WD40 repeat-containing subunit B1 homolog isoform X4 [Camelina sativa]|uniref:Katanin p80 WD40 repeat-containing subunit B1 homolog n=1 Tax=Camelina sativa TaxID=90675 RepID=A0ABM0T5G1_CAMSA|nr:PREDICTED: katanin p80 WD40 repeat-containing subunit B1 homolog isoform X4 [Camelina sativa]
MTTKRAYKLQEFVAHSAAVNCLKIGRKSTRVLVTGGEDHKVNLWAIGKPNAILSLYGHSSGIDSVTFDASEGLVAAGAASGTIKFWDLEEAKIVRTLTGHRSNCISVDFHPFGSHSRSQCTQIHPRWSLGCIWWRGQHCEACLYQVWDLTAGKLLTEFKSHEGQIQSLDFHPHEFLLATGSADRTVKFWDLETFELIGSGGPETAGVRCLSFNPDGKTVLCGLQESLKIFSWEPIRCHDGVDVGWSRLSDMNVHEGKLLGCSYNQSCVGVWVVDLSRTEPCMAGDTAQSNGHPEKRSCSGRDPVILNDNNSKTILGKLSVSQNVDPLLKETKSLERLSVSQNSDSSTKETKSIGRSSISQNSDSSMKESKPLGRLSVSQNSDFSKEPRTLSSTGSLPSTPHRVNSTNVSKATSGGSTAVSNAATSRRNFTKANPKANPVNKAADFAPVIVPRADPRIEQATESRAELDIIARTMPYSLQAADSRRSPSSRNNPDLPNTSVLEMSESQLVEPNNILDGGTLPGGKVGMRGAPERSINDFRYKRYGRSNSRSRMGSPPRNHDENFFVSDDLVSHKSNRDPSPTESQKGGRFQPLVINRERRGRFSNFEGPVSNFSSGNVPVPNIRPSNMFKQRGNHMPVEQGVDSPSEDNIVEDIMGKHDQFVSSMQSRLAKLQVVRRYWERNDVKNSIGSIEKMADNAVTADVLGIITERNETLTLDNCTSLLPLLTALLGSDMDQHLSVSLDLLLKLVRLYGSPIYSSLSAPASVGVDIEAEQRIERYSRCFVELEKVKACLPSLARRGGLVAKSVLELNLAFQEVSS